MRVLVVYAHPLETSFIAGLNAACVDSLRAAGHSVDNCDLYAEGFDPVLSRQERIDYHDTLINRRPVARDVERLLAAEALVLVFPVWNYGFPAMLKGYLDRVFLPGVSFQLTTGGYDPSLRNIKRLTAVCTYGGGRWRAMLNGDPPRRCVKRMLRLLIDPYASCCFLGHYDMNNTTSERRRAFLAKVERHFAQW
jgi:NAD(P)H dehydrogenase (quinone)